MTTVIPFTDYGVSYGTGFIPDLPDSLPEYYRPWHELASNMTSLLASKRMREETLKLPLLDTSQLATIKDLQLAHLQLCIISSGYCWGRGPIELPKSVPASVAIPFCDVSDKLGMQPGMSYYCLTGNWKRIDKTRSHSRDNIQVRYQLLGGQQFIDFTLLTVQLETSFAQTFPNGNSDKMTVSDTLTTTDRTLEALEDLIQGLELNDASRVARGLKFLTQWVQQLELISKGFHQIMQPETFFHEVIALFRGFNESWGLPEGMTFDGVTDRPKRKVMNSAASQTVIFQIIDLLLRIEYPLEKQNYFAQLRESWPSQYRKFFQFLQSFPGNVRDMAKSGISLDLTEAYNELVSVVQHFRTYHLQLVTK